MHAGVVVPVRAFSHAKARLADHLAPARRATLARTWATTVVEAAQGLLVVVVSSDPEVVAWAAEQGAAVVADPGSLDEAADQGRRALAAQGCERVVVAHADLPLARTFAPVLDALDEATVAIVPCHRDDGTPVLSIPAEPDFPFAYGPGSFRRHVAIAESRGLTVRVVRDPALAFDVDTPADLELLMHARAETPE